MVNLGFQTLASLKCIEKSFSNQFLRNFPSILAFTALYTGTTHLKCQFPTTAPFLLAQTQINKYCRKSMELFVSKCFWWKSKKENYKIYKPESELHPAMSNLSLEHWSPLATALCFAEAENCMADIASGQVACPQIANKWHVIVHHAIIALEHRCG